MRYNKNYIMGCSESMNAEIKLLVELNTPIFKKENLTYRTKIRTHLRDFCKKIISSNLSSEYRDANLSFVIRCKDKTYSMKDCIALYDLRVMNEDTVSIAATLLQPKNLELTLRIISAEPKEITLKVAKTTLVRDLLDPDSRLRFIRGDIELDQDQTIESYDIMNKSKLHVLVDNAQCSEIQSWKVKKTGLVLEASCINVSCMAYRQRICINLGTGEFDIMNEISQDIERYCVCCTGLLGKTVKYGFCHCAFKYLEENSEGDSREVCGKTKDFVEGAISLGSSSVIVTVISLY